MSGAPGRDRNTSIALLLGSFVLPLAGLVGAFLLVANDERPLARNVTLASLLGAAAYLLVIFAL